MKKYTVHIYTVVRVKMEPIEAASQRDAIKIATARADMHSWVDYVPPRPLMGVAEIEDAEEISGYLVDEEGDKEYHQSRFYKPDGETVDFPNDNRETGAA